MGRMIGGLRRQKRDRARECVCERERETCYLFVLFAMPIYQAKHGGLGSRMYVACLELGTDAKFRFSLTVGASELYQVWLVLAGLCKHDLVLKA